MAEHINKKRKTEPDRVVVFNVVRTEYYCMNLVRNHIRSYRTMAAATDGMHAWMMERMKEDIIERKELRGAFSKSMYYPEMKQIATKLEAFIAEVRNERKEKKKYDWTKLELAIKMSIEDSGKSIEEVYKRFFAQEEYAHYSELMEII